MLQRELADRKPQPASLAAGTDAEHEAGALAGSDEDVLGPGRAVHEVPGAEPPLLALDEEQALAREHEEPLLRVLSVVERVRLARTEDPDAEAELLEADVVALEDRVQAAELSAVEPACSPDVEHEPSGACRGETAVHPLERGLGHHRL